MKIFVFCLLVFFQSACITQSSTDSDTRGAQSERRKSVQKVIIDTFRVPAGSRAAFLDNTREAQSFLKTLPGFVEGYIYEKKAGNMNHDFITTAVWESEADIERAKTAIAEEFKRRGFDPQAFRTRAGIESERGVFERSPY